MGKLWNALRAVMMVSKGVARRCALTGELIFETVMSLGAAPVASSGIEDDVEPISPAPAVDRLAAIRRLVCASATDTVYAAAFEGAPEDAVRWLSCQSRGQLAKIVCAGGGALTAHITGKMAIRGVVAYDRDSVAAYERVMRAPLIDDGIQHRVVFAPIGVAV